MAKNTYQAKSRQTEVPGTEAPDIPEIDEAALEYRAVRDKRMALTKQETAALERLAAVLEKHHIDVYRFETEDGERLKVERITAKIKIKVRKDGSGDEAEDGPEVEG